MPARPQLAIRADGGPGIGVGHLSRALALVQAWNDRHGDAVLVTKDIPEFWARQFLAEGCTIVDPTDPPGGSDWRAVDGYRLGGARSAPQGSRLLLIDDRDGSGTAGADADLVLDQNLGVDRGFYPAARDVLTGPRYCLLRRGIASCSPPAHEPKTRRQVLVVLGGAPSPAVRALGAAVVADPRLADLDMRVLQGGEDIAAALDAADLAFAAAGTISWELCSRGIPAVLVSVAPNQDPVATELSRLGAASFVPTKAEAVVEGLLALLGDPARRQRMASVARSLVDGLGARRVVCRLRSELLVLRPVDEHDAELLFAWSNDPVTRASSFSSADISWEDHNVWLRARLESSSSFSYIASDRGGREVGLIRFDRPSKNVEVGVTVAPSQRGQGWGGALVLAGCRRLRQDSGPVRVEARIKPGNVASVRAFVDADFDPIVGEESVALRYALDLDDDE